MNILVVEPSPVVRQFCAQVFTKAGQKVLVVSDGQKAIDIIDQEKIDICFINPNLPKNSGLELIYELASYSDTSQMKIILLPDDADYYQEHKKQLSSLGVVAVLKRTEISEDSLLRVCLSASGVS